MSVVTVNLRAESISIIDSLLQRELSSRLGHRDGLCNLTLTGCTAPHFGLSVNENCDPTVQSDHLAAFRRLDPSGFQSGPVLARGSMSLPVRGGKLKRGTWQGVYLMNCSKEDSKAFIAVTCVPAVSTTQFNLSGGRGSHMIPKDKWEKLISNGDVVVNFCELHTSASLSLLDAESAKSLEDDMSRVVPETWNLDIFRHVYEGPDDMPGHMKCTLLGCSHSLSSSALNDSQGIGTPVAGGVGHTRTLELTAVEADDKPLVSHVKVYEEVMKQLDLCDTRYAMANLTVDEGYSLVVGCDIIPEVSSELLPYAAVGNGRSVDVPLKQECKVWVVPQQSPETNNGTDLTTSVKAVYFGASCPQ
ncbi:hypothetical protein FOZ60_002121 [Perkinsus olseni]|uniref:Uncharacterized protein n=1 Tax=Perkinsus olseni TaxID=32597 RepID=A0A7J6NZR7_PEROL|nr:hypothetical protein FOZ60_002121 [Perkinsus olseni]